MLVPPYVQHLIATRAPHVAYVPARGVAPFRYHDFETRGGTLRIRFASRTEPTKTILFTAQPFHGVCRSGATASFQMAGVKVWSGTTALRQTAWRCLHGVRLSAWTTMGLRRFAAAGLARIVASGHRIR